MIAQIFYFLKNGAGSGLQSKAPARTIFELDQTHSGSA